MFNFKSSVNFSFPVELKPIYFYDKNLQLKETEINGTPQRSVVRTDTDVALSVCSDEYVIITHQQVADYADSVMQHLGFKESSANCFLWKNGAVMHLFSEMRGKTVCVGNTTLTAHLMACNSYNREELARIEVRFIDENGTIYGSGIETSIKANKLAKHKVGHKTADEEFGILGDEVSEYITMVANLWSYWNTQFISGQRLKIMARLTTPDIAKKLFLRGKFNTGMTRFEFYKVCCEDFFNTKNFEKEGKMGQMKMSKIRRWMTSDDFFDENKMDLARLTRYVNKLGNFTYQELAERKKAPIVIS